VEIVRKHEDLLWKGQWPREGIILGNIIGGGFVPILKHPGGAHV
jgi:hypothetical protein